MLETRMKMVSHEEIVRNVEAVKNDFDEVVAR